MSLIALSNRHSGMHAKEGMLIMTKQYHEYPHEANISTKRLFDDAEEWRFQTLRKKLLNYFHHLVLEVNEPIENMVCQGKAALKGKYGVIDFDDPYPISGTVIEQTTASKFNDKDKELLAEEISYLYKLNDSQHFRFQWKEGGPWEEMKQRDYLHAKSKTTVELYISADGAPCRLIPAKLHVSEVVGDTSKNVLEKTNDYLRRVSHGEGKVIASPLELSNEMTIYSAVSVTIGDRQQLVCADSKGVPYTLTYEFSFHHDAQRNAEGQNELRRKFRSLGGEDQDVEGLLFGWYTLPVAFVEYQGCLH